MIKVDRSNQAQGQKTQRGVQFLSPKHILNDRQEATITKVTTDKPDNFGNPYVVYYKFGGQKYSKGYSETSDALMTLVDLFGEDEKKWIDKKVILGKVSSEETGTRLTYAKG